ncbi:DedA family protein [Sphingomonas metalli]|uniref:DedA family protein n=1 Tax=Sphingomonas metalli TaxID=1779358 RepID=A0A916TBH8_9SPHN|nr:DedA family protein [Sphingomonas metalli]GGB38885.1 DedA family protein [Sphingomonas metalli]
MTIEAIIARYGLIALFFGAGLEGETAVVTGGILSHRGLLPLAGAAAVAVAGSFVADQLFFLIGRRFRHHPRVRRIMARPAFARALAAFERRPTGFILGFRFLYGLRTISPIAIGTTSVAHRQFLALNALAAIVWGVTFTGLGYVFGDGLEALFHRYRPSGTTLVLAGLGAVLLLLGWGQIRRWRRNA